MEARLLEVEDRFVLSVFTDRRKAPRVQVDLPVADGVLHPALVMIPGRCTLPPDVGLTNSSETIDASPSLFDNFRHIFLQLLPVVSLA